MKTDLRSWMDTVSQMVCEAIEDALSVRTPDQINPNAKVVLPTLYRGVEGGTDAQRAIRMFKGGDLGDGVYVTADKSLAQSYGGGWKASIKNGGRVVHAYSIDPLFPEDVAFLFGGLRADDSDPTCLVTGNGIEIYRGEWSGAHLESALRGTGIKLVIGTPDSVGINQIAVRDPTLLHPLSRPRRDVSP